MNKIKKYSLTFLIFTIIILLFKYNYVLQTSVIDGVTLWLTKVFPSLFIMFVINDLIINLNIFDSITKYFNPIFNKIFKTKGNSSEVFFLSIFSGTPASAFIIKEMLNTNKITINDANKLISFTFFSNPLFLYNILTLSFNKYITLKIILIHYLSNIIIGLIYRNKNNVIDNLLNYSKENNHKNIFLILPNSIKKSIETLITILGTIIFYMIITNLLMKLIPFNKYTEIIIKGILEITQSLNILPSLKIKSIIKEITAIAIISFGGLSIHTQTLSIINGTKIKYKNFLTGRILHVLISTNTYLFFYFTTIC